MNRQITLSSTHNGRAAREAQQAQANREELIERLDRATHANGRVEPLPGLHLFRVCAPTDLVHNQTATAFCVIAQGCKELLLGDDRYRYDPAHYLLTTAELPVVSQVVEASPERPYLSLRLDLDPVLVGSVMVEVGHAAPRRRSDVRAIDVSPLDANLLDAVVRLVRLIDSPAEARILAPGITREIVYRLLVGEQGDRLRHVAILGGQSHRIAQAIDQLRKEFNQPLRIEDIARELGMSVSAFHQHFKAVTAMSPLQFQKQLRLQEARRLLLVQGLDAASAGYRVGYDDASHFNREYKRLFGLPPMRDVERLRETATARPN